MENTIREYAIEIVKANTGKRITKALIIDIIKNAPTVPTQPNEFIFQVSSLALALSTIRTKDQAARKHIRKLIDILTQAIGYANNPDAYHWARFPAWVRELHTLCA